jgi:hypothetical protein
MFLFAAKLAGVAAQALDAREVSSGIEILDEDGIIDRLQRSGAIPGGRPGPAVPFQRRFSAVPVRLPNVPK